MSPAQARALQDRLRRRVVPRGRPDPARIAGLDVSEMDGCARAAVVVVEGGVQVEAAVAELPAAFPYVPGLLSFRELPALEAAWRRLRTKPGLIVVDGHGRAHPRRFGLACHAGLRLGVPSIGCAKSVLVGDHAPLRRHRGDVAPLVHDGEIVGAAVRTREGVRPVYVSVGHRVSLDWAIRMVLGLASRYRLPEPQRLADLLSKRRRP